MLSCKFCGVACHQPLAKKHLRLYFNWNDLQPQYAVCNKCLTGKERPSSKNNLYAFSKVFAKAELMELAESKDYDGYLKYVKKIESSIQQNEALIKKCIDDIKNASERLNTLKEVLSYTVAESENYKELHYEHARAVSFYEVSKHKKEVFKRDGNKCVFCGSTRRLEIDHIKPVLLGGGNEIENLQVLCKSCNCRKGAKYEESKS